MPTLNGRAAAAAATAFNYCYGIETIDLMRIDTAPIDARSRSLSQRAFIKTKRIAKVNETVSN